MSKFKADVNVGNARDNQSAMGSNAEHHDAAGSVTDDVVDDPDFATTAATIGAVGVVVALLDIALIPGMVIGVAAAFAPKYARQAGERLQPLFNYTVRGAYKVTRKARSAVAEAQERMHDIASEVEAEEAAEVHAEPRHAVS